MKQTLMSLYSCNILCFYDHEYYFIIISYYIINMTEIPILFHIVSYWVRMNNPLNNIQWTCQIYRNKAFNKWNPIIQLPLQTDYIKVIKNKIQNNSGTEQA